MLDVLGLEGLGHHVRGRRERLLDVAAIDHMGLEEVPLVMDLGRPLFERLFGIDDRLEHLVLDLDRRGRGARRRARGRRHCREHVADVSSRLALGHQNGPVVVDRTDIAFAGDVGRKDDLNHSVDRLGLRDVDPFDHRPRMLREPHGPVEHVLHRHVVDERLLAERELEGFVLRRPGADPPRVVEAWNRAARKDASGLLDRVDDLHVAGATAEVAGESLGDLVARGGRVLLEEVLRFDDDAGRAESTLGCPGCCERKGERLSIVVGQTLEGDDLLAGEARRGGRARHPCLAVDDDRARSAVTLRLAAVLGGQEAEPVTQRVQESLVVAHF